ncbi:MAG: nucleotide exchange factor GrpE [Nanoarchaeota archaeon]|nr:nucleotide exchange factor GrpE [Nanoarchaeota archaeon]
MKSKQAENKENHAEAKGPSEGNKPVEAMEASEVAEARKEPIQDYIEQLQRLQAEFENFKKREEREKERHRDFAKAGLLLKLLNLNDDFERTLAVLENEKCVPNDKSCVIKEGIGMIAHHLKKVLAEEGVQPISCVGQKLDPFRHEVLVQEKADREEGIVLEELQKGYLFKGNVLRTAKVKVCKAVQKEADEKESVEEFENKNTKPEVN